MVRRGGGRRAKKEKKRTMWQKRVTAAAFGVSQRTLGFLVTPQYLPSAPRLNSKIFRWTIDILTIPRTNLTVCFARWRIKLLTDEEWRVCSLDRRAKTNWSRSKQAAKEDTKTPLWSVLGSYNVAKFGIWCHVPSSFFHNSEPQEIGDPDKEKCITFGYFWSLGFGLTPPHLGTEFQIWPFMAPLNQD